jgi:transposase
MDLAQTALHTVILAEDEAAVYLQASLQAVWAPCGQTPVVRVDPSRASTHFYGTLNLLTGQALITRTATLNAETTAQHLEHILRACPDVNVLLLWDRAPWHSGAPIRAVLDANPRLEIMAFPTASPELNPQEHVWKDARRAVSHNHQLARLPELADRFEHHLTSTKFVSSFLDRYGYTAVRPMFI